MPTTDGQVRSTLKCTRCDRKGWHCDRVDRSEKCTSCVQHGAVCERNVEYELLDHFRDNIIKTLVDPTLVFHFTALFHRYYKSFPVLLYCAIALAAIEKESLRNVGGYFNLASTYAQKIVSSVVNLPVTANTWRPYHLSYTMYAPFKLYQCHSMPGSFMVSVSNTIRHLHVYFSRLGPYKADLYTDKHIARLFKNPVTYSSKPRRDEFENGRPIALLYKAIDSRTLRMDQKLELKLAVEYLYDIHISIWHANKGNSLHSDRTPQNNDKVLFTWMTVQSVSQAFWDGLVVGHAGEPDQMWQTLVCHWGLVCSIRKIHGSTR